MSKYPDMHIKKVFPNWVWVIYILLFVFSIPWYFSEPLAMQLVLGLPLWLISSIGVIALSALFTVFILNKYWKDE